MTNSANKFWKKFFCFFILEGLVIFGSLWAWGFTGQVNEKRLRAIVSVLPPFQKEQLAMGLNFYYEQTAAKYTRGLFLSCEPETESMLKQFAWFHRNTFTYYMKGEPPYHEILVSTIDYFDIMDEDEAEKLSTYRLESKLIYWQTEKQKEVITDKDKSDLLLTLVDFGTSLFLGGTTPVGLSVAAVSLLSKASSDPAKCVPAIVIFHKIRVLNLSVTLGVLTLLNLILCQLLFRKKP